MTPRRLLAISALTLRAVLDSIGTRLDESREIARYLTGLLVFLEIFLISFTPLTLVLGISVDGRRYRLHRLEPNQQRAPQEHLEP